MLVETTKYHYIVISVFTFSTFVYERLFCWIMQEDAVKGDLSRIQFGLEVITVMFLTWAGINLAVIVFKNLNREKFKDSKEIMRYITTSIATSIIVFVDLIAIIAIGPQCLRESAGIEGDIYWQDTILMYIVVPAVGFFLTWSMRSKKKNMKI